MLPFPEWVIFHVPHDSKVISAEVRHQFALDDAALMQEIIKMTDHHTLNLFTHGVPEQQIIRSPVSRLVVDVERFLDDIMEPMATRGVGVKKALVNQFEIAGYSTALNTPFAGSLVPMPFYQIDSRVSSVMVEVNRALYCDEKTGEVTANFDKVARQIHDCLISGMIDF